jgi:hypothetical protein
MTQNKNSDNAETQSCKTGVTKPALLSRYFILENRLKILNRIKERTYYNELFKIRRLNKLIFITKRKVLILENHLSNSLQSV